MRQTKQGAEDGPPHQVLAAGEILAEDVVQLGALLADLKAGVVLDPVHDPPKEVRNPATKTKIKIRKSLKRKRVKRRKSRKGRILDQHPDVLAAACVMHWRWQQPPC